MDATVRQRTVRAATLMGLGVATTLLVSLDPARALRTGAFWAMLLGMLTWTVAENLALRQDEPKDYRGKRGTRLMQGGVMLAALVAVADFFHLPPLLPRAPWMVALGLVVLAAGAALRLVAIRTLARHFRYELRVEAGQRLMDQGVYARVRHPSYAGLILLSVGSALIFSSLLGIAAAALVLGALSVQRIAEEEQVLREAFGAEYDAYSARTWRLIPYVY